MTRMKNFRNERKEMRKAECVASIETNEWSIFRYYRRGGARSLQWPTSFPSAGPAKVISMESFKAMKTNDLWLRKVVKADVPTLSRMRTEPTTARAGLVHGEGRRPIAFGRVADHSRLVPPPDACAAKKWRFRRNMVIYVAYSHGISQRELADVFDLPQSRISAIVREISHQLDSEPTSNSRARPTGESER